MVGLFAGRMEWVRDYSLAVLLLVRPIPPVAIIPLVIVWFGIGPASKVLSTAFAVFFPVFTATYQGARNLPDSYLWAARSVRLPSWSILFRVVLPGTLNVSMAGIRVGIAMAFIMVYVTELAGSSDGLGYQIALMHLNYRIDRMMAALAVLATCAALTDLAVSRVASWLFPWLGREAV
jgi:NitT/TauT family transport system permease protein